MAAAEEIGREIAQAKNADMGDGQPVRRVRRRGQEPSIPFPLIVIGIIILLSLVSRGGGGSGFLTGMILGNMMGGRGGWGGGGFGGAGGGWSGGGGGFGGFGGGDSGGGGASGGW